MVEEVVVQTRCGGEASYSFGNLGVLAITEPDWRRAGRERELNVRMRELSTE